MPKLTEETQLARQAAAARVMGILFWNPRLSIAEACEQVGISERQYREWVQSGTETVDALRGYLGLMQRELLADISIASLLADRLIAKDAIDPLTSPKDRVTLAGYMNQRINELQRVFHAAPGFEEDANKFLKEGPVIEKKKSRLASIDVERTEDGVTINVSQESDVIDITPDYQPLTRHDSE